jgi:RHS repeat-associated protein
MISGLDRALIRSLYDDRAHFIRIRRGHFAGPAVELLQSFALHLQFHLRILFEDLRVSLAKHLSHPFIAYASGTQPRGISGSRVVDSEVGNLSPPKSLVPNRLEGFSDYLGSADTITDASGNIEKQSDYFPFGGEIVVVGSDPNNYEFTGKERDSESGLDNFGARYYILAFGRFMTPDWAEKPTSVPYANFGNPQSLNLYRYVENNPTTTGDPDGHQCEICYSKDGIYDQRFT